MGFLLASLIATITGTSKLYLSNQSDIMFWLGIFGIVLISLAFIGLVRHLHKKIDDLEELRYGNSSINSSAFCYSLWCI